MYWRSTSPAILSLGLILLGLSCESGLEPLPESDPEPLPQSFAPPDSITLNSANWSLVAGLGDGFTTIFFIDESYGWVVGENGMAMHTRDGGDTWYAPVTPTENRFKSIYFLDRERGFASGYGRTLITTGDGGFTWTVTEIVDGEGTIFSSLCADPGNDNLYFISNYGEIFTSGNAGQTWTRLYEFNEFGYSYLHFASNETAIAGQFGSGHRFSRTTDGGTSWTTFDGPDHKYSGDYFFLNDSIGWVTDWWGPSSTSWHDTTSVYRTLDGGANWAQVSTFITRSLLRNIVFTTPNHGWMSGYFYDIYSTMDGGESWTLQATIVKGGFIQDIYFLDDNSGWALTSLGIIMRYEPD